MNNMIFEADPSLLEFAAIVQGDKWSRQFIYDVPMGTIFDRESMMKYPKKWLNIWVFKDDPEIEVNFFDSFNCRIYRITNDGSRLCGKYYVHTTGDIDEVLPVLRRANAGEFTYTPEKAKPLKEKDDLFNSQLGTKIPVHMFLDYLYAHPEMRAANFPLRFRFIITTDKRNFHLYIERANHFNVDIKEVSAGRIQAPGESTNVFTVQQIMDLIDIYNVLSIVDGYKQVILSSDCEELIGKCIRVLLQLKPLIDKNSEGRV